MQKSGVGPPRARRISFALFLWSDNASESAEQLIAFLAGGLRALTDLAREEQTEH